MAFINKRQTLAGLSLLNLLLAVSALGLHLPRHFPWITPHIPESFFPWTHSSITVNRLISAVGLLAALVELLLTVEFLTTPVFWSMAFMAGGWGMLIKTGGLGFDHLVVSGSLALVASTSLWLCLLNPRNAKTATAEKSDVRPKSTNRILNPSVGLNIVTGKKVVKGRRHTAPAPFSMPSVYEEDTDSSAASFLQPQRPLGSVFSELTDTHLTKGISSLGKFYRIKHPESSSNTIGKSAGQSEAEVSAGPRRGSSNRISIAFKDLPDSVLPKPNALSVLHEEDVGQSDAPPSLRKRVQNTLTFRSHTEGGGVKGVGEVGWVEGVLRFSGGLVLGCILVVALGALIVLVDTLYPVHFIEELARISRRNFAMFLKIAGFEPLA